MILESFQLLGNEAIVSSIIERDFLKNYHQQAANSNDSDHIIEFDSGENKNYHQIGNTYLKYEMTIEKVVAKVADRVFVDGDVLRLNNNAFEYCSKEAILSTTGGSDLEHSN